VKVLLVLRPRQRFLWRKERLSQNSTTFSYQKKASKKSSYRHKSEVYVVMSKPNPFVTGTRGANDKRMKGKMKKILKTTELIYINLQLGSGMFVEGKYHGEEASMEDLLVI
jgi:hypothetical protein